MSSQSYFTIRGPVSARIEVRRSVFLCKLTRVESEDAARGLVAATKREHWDARHHCSAFVIGAGGELARSSDDSEPAGTAGAPMLEVLRGAGLSDVAAVVTRWFGGVLLGTGGLVRAYSDAVRAALELAHPVRRELLYELEVRLSHAEAGRVEAELRGRGLSILDVSYGADVALIVGSSKVAATKQLVARLSSGKASVRQVGERWIDIK